MFLLLIKKITNPTKLFDFINIFSKKTVKILFKRIMANEYAKK